MEISKDGSLDKYFTLFIQKTAWPLNTGNSMEISKDMSG